MTAHYQAHGDVAVITLDNPPVNGMGLLTRRAFVAGMQQAAQDAAIRAIVLTGAGKAFSGGADIKEFGTPVALQEPNLHTMIALAESCPKPVIAAMHSVVIGGGLELSLGCHYRVAAPGASVGLPEVKLGLLPGAGGTQRLPRAIGVESALKMIVSGEFLTSEVLAALPGQKLIDRMAASAATLLDEAVAFARTVAEVRPVPRVRDLPCSHPLGGAFFESARERLKAASPHLLAPAKCVDAVEVATTHAFDEGAAWERDAFIALMDTPQSRALRHLFFAERAASKVPGVPAGTAPRPVRTVAVIGQGTLGCEIAMGFLKAGITVWLLDAAQDALDQGVIGLRANLEAQAGKGQLSPAQLAQRMALLRTTVSYQDLTDADLVIEALADTSVTQDLEAKEHMWRALDSVLKPGAILASTTSPGLNDLAAFTIRPQDVVGLNFGRSAPKSKLLEIVRGAQTAADVLATAMAVARKLGKTAVVSGAGDGSIGQRMFTQFVREASLLLDEGCEAVQVDRALENFDMVMGPFRVAELAGGGARVNAVPGASPLQFSDEAIVQRLVLALVNEGTRLLQEGVASKASDIDMVCVLGLGFPPHLGGPMHYAGEFGLSNAKQPTQGSATRLPDDPKFSAPAPAFQIRPIQPAELEAARQLLLDNGWDRKVNTPDEFRELVARSSIALVAVKGSEVLGFLRALTDGMTNGYISMLVVGEKWRGQGVGQALLKAAMGEDRSITWVLRASRSPTLPRFYEKLGFAVSAVAMERVAVKETAG